MPGRLLIGQIAAPHGVKGLVRVRSFTDDPDSLFAYRPLTDESGVTAFNLIQKGFQKGGFLVAIDGVTTREAAEALRGQKLYIDRAFLPPPAPGEFYVSDLIGLMVKLEDGTAYGRIASIHNFGAGDILEIVPVQAGDSLFLPFKDAFVPAVDLAQGAITIRLPQEL